MGEEPKKPASEGTDANGEVEEAPIRVCPTCSAQSRTQGDACPHCGASLIRSRSVRMKKRLGGMSRRRKAIIGAVVVGLLVGGVAAGVIAKVNHDNKIAREKQEAEEARELARQEAKEQAAEEAKEIREEEKAERALAALEAELGHEMQHELEDAITADANEEAEEGFSEYVSDTKCEPEGGVIEASVAAQNFSCIAITEEEGGSYEGYRYTGTVNYKKGEYSWRLGGP